MFPVTRGRNTQLSSCVVNKYLKPRRLIRPTHLRSGTLSRTRSFPLCCSRYASRSLTPRGTRLGWWMNCVTAFVVLAEFLQESVTPRHNSWATSSAGLMSTRPFHPPVSSTRVGHVNKAEEVLENRQFARNGGYSHQLGGFLMWGPGTKR